MKKISFFLLFFLLSSLYGDTPIFVPNSYHASYPTQAQEQSSLSIPEEIASQSTFLNPSKTFFQKQQEFLITLLYGLSAALFIGFLLFNRHLYRSRKQITHREETLKKLSESLNTAQKIAHLGNWEWDIKADTLWWSDEIYRIFGLGVQQFAATYEAFIERIHPDDREKVQDAVNRSLVSGIDYRVEHRIITPDGTIRHVLEEGRTHRDEEGNPLGMIGIVQDITEAKKAQTDIEESERKYRVLVETAMIGIFRSDLSGTIRYVNPALVSILSCNSAEEMIGKNIAEMYRSSDKWDTFTQRLLREGGLSNCELTAYDKNATPIPVMMNATLDGDVLTGMMIDLREMKKSRDEIDKLSKAVEQIDDTVTITDNDGVITYVNQAFFLHTGYSKEETLGNTLKLLKSGKHDKTFYENLWNTILRGEIFRGTLINRKKNGDLYYENKTITPLKDDQDNITGFVTTGKDVTLETLMHQELEQIATTDKLTGIYNRHKFEELFALEAERSRRFSLPLSMILIDIDHFKSINDTYGHDAGDDVLRYFSSIIRENIRKIDIFARWGGEEFLVLSPGTDLENIQKVAEKLRHAVETSAFPKSENVTISLGVSAFKEKDTFSTLFQRADQGLYHVKQHGRNQVGVIA